MRTLVLTVACMLGAAGCVSGTPVWVVCDQNGAGSDLLGDRCGHVAQAVVADLATEHPIEIIVVFAWRGPCYPGASCPLLAEIIVVFAWRGPCYPGASCPLLAEPEPKPWPVSAEVGVRFADGATSVMRMVPDVFVSRPQVLSAAANHDPDEFIDTRLSTGGSWRISAEVASGP